MHSRFSSDPCLLNFQVIHVFNFLTVGFAEPSRFDSTPKNHFEGLENLGWPDFCTNSTSSKYMVTLWWYLDYSSKSYSSDIRLHQGQYRLLLLRRRRHEMICEVNKSQLLPWILIRKGQKDEYFWNQWESGNETCKTSNNQYKTRLGPEASSRG